MTGEWIDISVGIRSGMVVWPGDAPVQVERVCDMARGDRCTVSRLSVTTHVGTHVDAPMHYVRDGASLDALSIEAMMGPARVVEIADAQAVTVGELEGQCLGEGERVLFKTRNSGRCWGSQTFVEDYVYIAPEAARYLAVLGVQTVGVDYLSVGGPGDLGEATHKALLGAGVWVIEGLDLSGVAAGSYMLACLPLKVVGADGAPARAVVRRMG